MSRPPTFDKAMTAAERMRRYRARKREPRTAGIAGAIRTQKDFARFIGKSPRYVAYLYAWQRYSLIEWEGDVIDGKYGRVGFAFLADVCRFGDVDAQRTIHDAISTHGAAYGRSLWRRAKASR
jgi:hypothetical protein